MPSFGFGHRFSRRRSLRLGSAVGSAVVLYGPHYGPKGPRKVLVSVWNQGDLGYCRETNNLAEPLYAKWASRGINCVKPSHPDAVLQGRATQLLAAVKANNLMLIAAPTWYQFLQPVADPSLRDYRDLALNDPYWRTMWIAYNCTDEMDLFQFPLATHVDFINTFPLGGVTKPTFANFTRRVASPGTSEGSATINWKSAFEVPQIRELSQDSYQFHLSPTLANAPGIDGREHYHLSMWNYGGVRTPGGGNVNKGKRFTASYAGMAAHLMNNGPLIPGRSDSGNSPVQYGPIAFNTPPYAVRGNIIPPQPVTYSPGDKALAHTVTTSRVDINITGSYPQGGLHAPARFLRDESWTGFIYGSSHLILFPQTVGSFSVMGYVDAATNRLTVTSSPINSSGSSISWGGAAKIGGAMEVVIGGTFTIVGFIDRDNPQVSGSARDEGVYRLDPAVRASVTTGSVGTPVRLEIRAASQPWGDDSDGPNLAELASIIANVNRMQAHPTGGNLLIDTVNGGRRPYTVLRCPDVDGDAALYKEDMTLAPVQAGYTSGGVPIEEISGLPLWEFGWPMGFEGFHTFGADGARYIYVKSMSNSNRPTFFPGYAALGLPARVFGAFELVGFRRVGSGTAVEMTGSSGVLKAGVDDGAATWFSIETAAITRAEGNSGSTAYAITVRRAGNLSGTNTVTASVSGTGITPASATDFAGGTLPSQVLSFAPTETSKVFTVNVNGDTSAEFNETFAVTLSSPSTGTAIVGSNQGSVTCTITNDDAALVGAFVWLVNTLTAPPSLSGSPAGAVHLRVSETTNVTRSGITMRSVNVGPPANDTGGFAGVPQWQIGNAFQGVRFELPAGNWEFAVIASSASWGGGISGTVTIKDDPAGANTTRQSLTFSGTGGMLADTDNTAFTSAPSALADAVGALTYVPVTVSNLGGGNGVVQLYANGTNVSAIALRQV